MKDNNILVSVLCTAYNHERFIKDAIESVIHQKTNFRYELIIHEDASTDKTAEIVKAYEEKYPELIRGIYQKKNQYGQCNIYETFLFPKVRGKYIAMCEGDDYWIDNEKLQRQVDFLENHEDYSMCMHNAIKFNFETGKKSLLNTFVSDGTYSQEEQIKAGLGSEFPAFASYMLRTEFLKAIPHFFLEQKVLDYPLRQYYAGKGLVYYFEKPMSVYRMATPHSYMKQTTKNQEFYNNYTLEMIRFFEKFDVYENYQFHDLIGNKILSDYFGYCLSIEESAGKKKAKECGLNMQIIEACYRCFSTKHIRDSILSMPQKSNHLFIYGISRFATLCRKQLEEAGIKFEGYVVSDGQMKPDRIEGKPVYYLKEVLKNYENPSFLLAVQPVNADTIIRYLKQNNVENYYRPYTID